jgi:hypothetical protein
VKEFFGSAERRPTGIRNKNGGTDARFRRLKENCGV